MAKKIGMFVLVVLFLCSVVNVFATDMRVGRYIAGDSRNDLDYDYWLLFNSNGTVGIHSPDGAANGTWRYDGNYIYVTITFGTGEFSGSRGQTFTLWHLDATGTVIYDGDSAYWLQ